MQIKPISCHRPLPKSFLCDKRIWGQLDARETGLGLNKSGLRFGPHLTSCDFELSDPRQCISQGSPEEQNQ